MTWICLLVTGATTPASGQAPEGDSKQVVSIILDSIRGTPVRTATYVRTASPTGDLLVLDDLEMSTGVVLGVRATDGRSALEVNLYKNGIPEPVRRGAATDGSYLFEFRTYGETGIEVKAPAPTDYVLTVIAGRLADKPAPSPFGGDPQDPRVAGRDDAAPAAVGTSAGAIPATTFVLGGLLLAAVFVIGFLVARRGRSAVPLLVLAMTLSASARTACAQEDLLSMGSFGDWVRNNPQVFEPMMQKVRTMQTPGPSHVGPDGKLLDPQGFGSGRGGPMDGGRIEQIVNLMQQLLTFAGKLGDLSRLGPYDKDYEPDLAPPGMPRVPLRCADDASCKACFAPAYATLNGVRGKLENNRIVLAHYTRRMQTIEDAGRAMGGMHGAAGILFLKNKQEWDAQRASIGGIYDTRYASLMTELQTALRGVETCESKAYGTTGWYDRFGFMYYEFMAARYRRTGGGF